MRKGHRSGEGAEPVLGLGKSKVAAFRRELERRSVKAGPGATSPQGLSGMGPAAQACLKSTEPGLQIRKNPTPRDAGPPGCAPTGGSWESLPPLCPPVHCSPFSRGL